MYIQSCEKQGDRLFPHQKTTSTTLLWLGLLLFGLASLLPKTTQALSVIKMTEQQLVAKSSLVVQGRVISKRFDWAPKKMGIITLVTLAVDEEVVGRQAPSQLVIRHYGGQIGETRVVMPENPHFEIGDEVVVVLESSPHLPKNEYLLVGWVQGQWHILRPQAFSATPLVAASRLSIRTYPTQTAQLQQAQKLDTLQQLKARLRQHWAVVKPKLPEIKILPTMKPIPNAPTLIKKPAIRPLAPNELQPSLQKKPPIQVVPKTPAKAQDAR